MRPTPLIGSGVHHYVFELYALDSLLDLPYDKDRVSIENAIKTHSIEKTELIGLYAR